jgi:hypothetical protein
MRPIVDAGVVDQDINLTEPIQCGLHHLLHIGSITDIGSYEYGFSSPFSISCTTSSPGLIFTVCEPHLSTS